jgi:hypothetical protein
MNVEVGTEATQFPEKEYINGIFLAVSVRWGRGIEELNTERPTSFWIPRNLSHHMVRQARTGDTVLVKSREMTSRSQTLPWWLGEER